MIAISWCGHVIELASLVLFGWCWLEAGNPACARPIIPPVWRGTPRRSGGAAGRSDQHLRDELVVAVGYGWLLETLDLWLFGTYHYEPVTWWWVGHVPLYIPLLWATILHSSIALSNRTGLPRWARPFLDGLFAVLIDLAIDAIAIRVGLWHWNIPLTEGWFGVPAGNLCAWMWVAAWYGGITRLVRQRIEGRGVGRWQRALVPFVAYAGLLVSLWLIGTTGRLLGLDTQRERLWLFAAHVVGFVGVVAWASLPGRSVRADAHSLSSLLWNRWLMHASFAFLLWASGLWRTAPVLLFVSAGAMALEGWAQRWVRSPCV